MPDEPRGARDARQRRVTGCKAFAAALRRRNGVAFPADNRASDVLRRLLEVVPRGLRRLWDGGPAPVSLPQFPARHHLAGKISIFHPALCYYDPFFTGLVQQRYQGEHGVLSHELPLYEGRSQR